MNARVEQDCQALDNGVEDQEKKYDRYIASKLLVKWSGMQIQGQVPVLMNTKLWVEKPLKDYLRKRTTRTKRTKSLLPIRTQAQVILLDAYAIGGTDPERVWSIEG